MPIDIQKDVPLAAYTTLGVGGPARYFVRAETEQDLLEGLTYAGEGGLPVFVLGGGSNILVSDDGFNGLVIQIAIVGIDIHGGRVTAAAGEDWDPFVASCVKNDLAGVECLSGIPGFVGGTPVQNVGAYGQEVAETIDSVRCLDRATHEIVDLNNAECGFTYRTSIFNSTMRDRYVVLSVTFDLGPGGKPKIKYKDLLNHFGEREPTLGDTRDAVLAIRRSKSMVIDSDDPNSKSAGSFFKNPIVDRSRLDTLETQVGKVPFFEFGELVKIPAAWLIENAGFHKGFVLGNAGTSSNHSLAVINRGGATAAEIVALKDKIQKGVKEKYGIELHPEPIFVGF